MEEIWRSKDFLNRGLSWTSFKQPTISVQERRTSSTFYVLVYRPAEDTDRVISNEELYLCDSGAQFR